jgi:hypothetical protein
MAKSTFNLFGPITKDDIRVGYISTDRGYVEGRSICDANLHAQKNPGAVFIFKPDRTTVEFLNINEVNALDPSTADTTISCPDGLKLEGEPDPPSVQFLGGGGIGAVANPVVGNDGSIMAIDLVKGGYGYQYPPIVKVKDDRGLGTGAIVNVGLGTIADQTIYYADEEDFEEVQLCADPFTDPSRTDGGKESKDASKRSAYGRRFSPSGKDLGPWRPRTYTEDKKIPFEDVVDDYLKKLAAAGKDWWTTRKEPPLRVNTDGKQSRTVYDVSHWAWGGGGTATALSDVEFEIYWHSPGRTTGLGFEFVAQDGSHSFTIRDTSRTVGQGQRTDTKKVKENVIYDVKVIGRRSAAQGSINDARGDNSKVTELAEQGLLKTMGKTKGGNLSKLEGGTGDTIFADFLDSLDDSDDIQIQAGLGRFTSSNPRKVNALKGQRTTYDLTYRVDKVPSMGTGSFSNSWTKDFPFGGYYKALLEVDDVGELWIDDEKVIDRKVPGKEEKLIYIDGPTSQEEFDSKGPTSHTIKVVAENNKSENTKEIDARIFSTLDWIGGGSPSPTYRTIKFKVSTASLYGNGIKIPELGIAASKKYNGANVNKTFERLVEVNKVYDVELTSNATPPGIISKDIIFQGLHPVNNPINVSADRKRLNLRDGHGTDANASFIIESGDVKFSSDGKKLEGSGEVQIILTWNDRSKAGRAIDKITIASTTWTRRGTRGTERHKINVPGNTARAAGVRLRTSGESVLQMEDHTDSSWDDVQCSATEGKFYDFKPGANNASCKFVVTGQDSGGVSGGTSRQGVTYQGPRLFHKEFSGWGSFMNKASVCQNPRVPNTQVVNYTWNNVDFPETGDYRIKFQNDAHASLCLDGRPIVTGNFDNEVGVSDLDKSNWSGEGQYKKVRIEKGKHTLTVKPSSPNFTDTLFKQPVGYTWHENPSGFAIEIRKKMVVGTGTYKTWKENPLGISAKLIPPPCPKKVSGKGVVVDPVVVDPGNGYPPGGGGGYPAALKLKDAVIRNGGINYNQKKDTISLLDPSTGDSNGAKLSLCEVGPFGQIEKVCIDAPGFFDRMPTVVVDSDTGVNLDLSLQFEVVRDPVVEDLPLVQVTDLVGLKQTGYWKGRPYYGAVFYQDGVKYAGWYETAGELVQIYDTMQESIDATVTTPPSAILRQGSDVSSNDPRLNIPGTPENLT